MDGAVVEALRPSLALLASAAGVVVLALAAGLRSTRARAGDLALLVFALSAAAAVSSTGADPAWIVERRVAFDAFANFFHVALSLGAVAVAWLSLRHRDGEALPPLSWTALAASLLSLQLLASACAVVEAWGAFVLAGVSMAAWTAAHRDARPAAAAVLLRGAVSSALLLLGFGLLVGLSGATDYASLSSRLAVVPAMPGGRAAMFTAVMLATAAFAERAAFAPWLLWPAAEARALPLPSSLWIVAGGSMGGLAALGRFLGSAVSNGSDSGSWASPGGVEWAPVLAGAGLLTSLAAGVAVLREANLRRLVAWIAVSQAGFLAVGLAGASASGLASALLHGVVSALTLTGIVAALEAVPATVHDAPIDAIRGLLRQAGRSRLPGLALLLFLLSWAGLWPLAGRVGRTAMLSSSVAAGQWILAGAGLAVLAVGWMGVVRLVAIMLDRGGPDAAPAAEGTVADGDALLLSGLLAVAVVAVGIDPSGLAALASRSVAFFAG